MIENTPTRGAAPATRVDSLSEPDPNGPVGYPAPQLGSGEQGPVRLVIHHTPGKLRPEVAALGFDMDAEFIDVSESDTAYFASFEKLWDDHRSWVAIEHDVLPTVELLEAMWHCDRGEWCAGFAWRYSGAVLPGESRPQQPVRHRETALFCNKFSIGLLARLPNAMKDAIARCPAMRWNQLDLALFGVLAQYGAEAHIHEPAVVHLRQEHPAWVPLIADDEWVDG
jgi:hypothetical protein